MTSNRPQHRTQQSALIALVAGCGWACGASATLLDEARALHRSGSIHEALPAYRNVIEAIESTPADIATAHNNSCVLLNELGRLSEALTACRSAAAIREDLANRRGLARSRNNLGLVLQNLGQFDEARTAYSSALSLNEALDDSQAQAINLGNLGTLATVAGDYSAALDFFQQVIDLADRFSETPWAAGQRRLAKINRGVALEGLGAYREALDAYLSVLEVATGLDERQRATLNVNVGVAYRNLGDPVSALEAFEQAAGAFDTMGDLPGLANTRLNLGLVYSLNLGDPASAESEYTEALRLAKAAGDVPAQMQSLLHLGNLLLDKGRYPGARDAYAGCLELADRSGSREGRWSALYGLGRIAAAQGEHDAARVMLTEAIDVLESTRRDLAQRRLREEFFGDKRDVYSAMVALLARMHEDEPRAGYDRDALAFVQRAKARELTDALRDDAPLGDVASSPGSGIVPRDEIVLEYFFAGPTLYVWVISSDGVRLFAVGDASTIRRAVDKAYRDLSHGRAVDTSTLAELSALLPGGADRPLGEARVVRIAPDGALHYLPFELLSLENNAGKLLVDSHVVTYLPAYSALPFVLAQDQTKRNSAVLLAGFGAGVSFSSDSPFAMSQVVDQFALDPLPQIRIELEALDRLLPGRHEIFVGSEATERAFRESVVQGTRVVHLAGHTVVDERRERGAAIVLTPADGDDGLLYPDEIAGLEYGASLTVLAACRTAFSGEQSGRQFSTLTGSLLVAGSAAVVATLWDVGDETTTVFMEQFYYRLGRGMSPADALRETKTALRRHAAWRDSGAWAAYVFVGEAAPVIQRRPVWAGFLTTGLLLTGVWAYLRRRTVPGGRGLAGS